MRDEMFWAKWNTSRLQAEPGFDWELSLRLALTLAMLKSGFCRFFIIPMLYPIIMLIFLHSSIRILEFRCMKSCAKVWLRLVC